MSHEPVLLVSESDWLARRVERALAPTGHKLVLAADPVALTRIRRQRPYHLCYLDMRRGKVNGLGRGLGRRSSERYVVLLSGWQRAADLSLPPGVEAFGYLREPFGQEELTAWVRRAACEARLQRGDTTLEDLLHGRFQHFLRDLGPESMPSLHDLIWQQVERPLILSVLEWTGGNQSRAAGVLGIHRNTLRAKIRRLGIPLSRRT